MNNGGSIVGNGRRSTVSSAGAAAFSDDPNNSGYRAEVFLSEVRFFV